MENPAGLFSGTVRGKFETATPVGAGLKDDHVNASPAKLGKHTLSSVVNTTYLCRTRYRKYVS